MITLIIDTSTERGIVALAKERQILFSEEILGMFSSKLLMQKIIHALSVCGLSINQLEKVAVGVGPGAFTGIRVGVATAKGLVFERDLPLIGFSTLAGFILPDEGVFASVIDARVGGAYVLLQERKNGEIKHLSQPKLSPLSMLPEVPFVGPNVARLNLKNAHEAGMDATHIADLVTNTKPSPLEILYLRDTF